MRPTVAVVTGFTKCPQLAALSLAPIAALKRKGVIDRIVALTWDTPAIDAFVAPIAAIPEVELIRVPQPELSGGPYRTGIMYQIRNLEAALRQVPEDDALIVKLRPDFVADETFLGNKIAGFASLCAPSDLGERFGAAMPRSPFAMKIWLPWADANQPFFCEDGAFMGLKRDVAKLADRGAHKYLDVLSGKPWGWFAHILRFVLPFLPNYPIFRSYLRNFRYFPNDIDYRQTLLPEILNDAFFIHLLVAHAWILATSFHVDCGAPGDLLLYTNTSNEGADWSRPETLKVNTPYNDVATWRAGEKPGGLFPGASRLYGRLMDDEWQHALFTTPALRDLSPDNVRGILHNVTQYRKGVLADAEAAFLLRLSGAYRARWERSAA